MDNYLYFLLVKHNILNFFLIKLFFKYRLVFITTITVHKFFSDYYHENKYLAKVGRLSLEETIYLQRVFLEMLDYDINITDQEYQNYESSII